MTRPGHWRVTFTNADGSTNNSPTFATKAAAEAFRDERLRHASPYLGRVTARLYEYMDNGSYRARGTAKESPVHKMHSTSRPGYGAPAGRALPHQPSVVKGRVVR